MVEIVLKIICGIGGALFGAWEVYDGAVQVKEGFDERKAMLNGESNKNS